MKWTTKPGYITILIKGTENCKKNEGEHSKTAEIRELFRGELNFSANFGLVAFTKFECKLETENCDSTRQKGLPRERENSRSLAAISELWVYEVERGI